VDPEVHEAQHIAEEHRNDRNQGLERLPVRHLELEHHDGDHDGNDAIAEGLETSFAHATFYSEILSRTTVSYPFVPGRPGVIPPNHQVDAPEGRNASGALPGESVLWVPSTGTCSLRRSARASRPPWRRRTDAPGYHPAGSGSASGNCARN